MLQIDEKCVEFLKDAFNEFSIWKSLDQQVRGSIPGGVVNFNLKIFNIGASRGGDVHFIIARSFITVLD